MNEFRSVAIYSIILVFASIASFSILHSQPGSTTFLLNPPSPISQAMGGTGVAMPTDDAFGLYFNPAILGISSESNIFSAQFYPVKHNFPHQSSIPYKDPYSNNFAIICGRNLDSLTGIPLSIGVGYLNQYTNYGQYTGFIDAGFGIIFPTKGLASTFSAAASLNLGIQLGIGFSVKSINSDLTRISGSLVNGDTTYSNTSATAFDFGLMAVIPVLKNYRIVKNVTSELNLSLGYSLSNISSKKDYTDSYAGLLPRMEKLGYDLNLVINYNYNEFKIKLIDADLTAEGDADLVAYSNPGANYKSILSSINIFDNIISANSSNNVRGLLGWKVNFLETLTFYGGQNFSQPDIIYDMYPSGFSIQTTGITKILNFIMKDNLTSFIANHINLRYTYTDLSSKISHGIYTTDEFIPYLGPGDYYNGIELIVKGFIF
jgi:hypothetical protein